MGTVEYSGDGSRICYYPIFGQNIRTTSRITELDIIPYILTECPVGTVEYSGDGSRICYYPIFGQNNRTTSRITELDIIPYILTECPVGTVEYSGDGSRICYYPIFGYNNQTTSRILCGSLFPDGDLAYIPSQEAMDFLSGPFFSFKLVSLHPQSGGHGLPKRSFHQL